MSCTESKFPKLIRICTGYLLGCVNVKDVVAKQSYKLWTLCSHATRCDFYFIFFYFLLRLFFLCHKGRGHVSQWIRMRNHVCSNTITVTLWCKPDSSSCTSCRLRMTWQNWFDSCKRDCGELMEFLLSHSRRAGCALFTFVFVFSVCFFGLVQHTLVHSRVNKWMSLCGCSHAADGHNDKLLLSVVLKLKFD